MLRSGTFPELENELCSWEPNSGMRWPNRLDWLVWALTELMLSDVLGADLLEWMRESVAAKGTAAG